MPGGHFSGGHLSGGHLSGGHLSSGHLSAGPFVRARNIQSQFVCLPISCYRTLHPTGNMLCNMYLSHFRAARLGR